MKDRYLGPTDASFRPRRAPWLFRGNNDRIALVVVLYLLVIWLNS